MKIGYMSDVHWEFKEQRDRFPEEHLDVLILAGDLHTKGRGLLLAYEKYKDHADHIIVIFGNHDYWGGTYQKIIAEARLLAAAIPNLHFLQNDAVCINGVWFIGSTLWTDYLLGPEPQDLNMWLAKEGMHDHARIKWTKNGQYRKMLPNDMRLENKAASTYIFETIGNIRANEPDAVIIVITHHGPTHKSLDPYYVGSKLNPCYVNTFDERLANDEGPNCWIHGHVHNDTIYQVGRTMVVCNPIGYPGQIPRSQVQKIEVKDE